MGLNPKAPAIPDDLSKANGWIKALSGYYKERASHPRWVNGISVASLPGIATAHIYDHAEAFEGTPVFMASEANGAPGQMGFVIPNAVVEQRIPEPSSKNVQIRKRAGARAILTYYAIQAARWLNE